jgi:hypothetical protein
MMGEPAKKVRSGTPGRSMRVYIERRPDVTRERFDTVVRGINAAELEELVPDVLSARIDSANLKTLEEVAQVSIMEEKTPKG